MGSENEWWNFFAMCWVALVVLSCPIVLRCEFELRWELELGKLFMKPALEVDLWEYLSLFEPISLL